MANLEGRTLGPYLLESRLGGGGMASVYRGRHRTLKQARAIKVMAANLADHPGFIQLFHREARLSAQLRHPNVVQMYDVGEQDGFPYLVMELLEGQSLRDVILQDRPLAVERAVHFVQQLAAALDYAHVNGVAHRDVKPANAFVSPTDHLTLVDFGIARAADGTRLSITHGIGTPEYMAPEVFDERLARPHADDHQLGVDADLYALGVVAYELLTGRLPFAGRTPQAIVFGQVHNPPEPLRTWRPELSARLESVVLSQLAKRPMERLSSPNAFAARLAEVVRLDRLIERSSAAPAMRDHGRAEQLLADAWQIDPNAAEIEALLAETSARRGQAGRSKSAADGPPDGGRHDAVVSPSVRPVPGVAVQRGPSARLRASVVALAVAGAILIVGSIVALRSGFGIATTAGVATPVVAAVSTPVPTPASTPTQVAAKPTAAVVFATSTTMPTSLPGPDQQLAAGRAALDAGDFARSIETLTVLRRTASDLPGLDDSLYQAHMKYGQALLEAQELDASWGQFEAALALRPNDPAADDGKRQIILAKEWERMEGSWGSNPDAAIAALEVIIGLDRGYRGGEAREKLYALLIAKADRLLEAEDRAGAVGILMRALDVEPDGGEVRMRLISYTPTPLPTATPEPVRPVPAPAQPAPARPPAQSQPQPQPQPDQPLRMPGRPV